jgi:CheY-like chemotaxis protein
MEPVNILLVEDNEGDILLTKEAFEDAKIHIKLSIARDGKEAINYIANQMEHRDGGLPDLILLDINLPKKSGHEVLKYIKDNEKSKHIPVIMLTTSSSETDINQSYNNYANCYITKPVEVNDFLAVIASIESFWISVVKLPTKNV